MTSRKGPPPHPCKGCGRTLRLVDSVIPYAPEFLMSVDVRRSPPIKAEIKARKRKTDHRNDLSFLTMMYIYEGEKGVGMYTFIHIILHILFLY